MSWVLLLKCAGTDHFVDVAGQSGSNDGLNTVADGTAGMSGDVGTSSASATENRHPTPPPPSPSVAPKRPFSAVETSSDSALPRSVSQAKSTHSASLTASSSNDSNSSLAKRSRMTGTIALTRIGDNFADFNATYRYGVDKEHERHEARMAERSARGQECGQAVARAQELETFLNADELAALLEVFEDRNSAKAYLGIKTDKLRKAWIKRKLTASGIIPSFV